MRVDEPDHVRSSAPANGWDAGLAADVAAIEPAIPQGWDRGDPDRRRALASWALMSIDEQDELWDVPEELRTVTLQRQATARAEGRDVDLDMASARYSWIDENMPRFLGAVPSSLRKVTDAVDAGANGKARG